MTARRVSMMFFVAAVLGIGSRAEGGNGFSQTGSAVLLGPESDTVRTELAFFDQESGSDASKAIKKFTAVDVSKIPGPVKTKVSTLYPGYTWINSGKNQQEEYALIILTRDSVRKTLVIKGNGEILSDK